MFGFSFGFRNRLIQKQIWIYIFTLNEVTLYKSGSDDWKVDKVTVDRKDIAAGARVAPSVFIFNGEKITKDGVTAPKSN